MLTVKDVASELRLSIGAVYKAINSGRLGHHRFGSSIRITHEQLAEFIEHSCVTPESPSTGLTRRFKHL